MCVMNVYNININYG